MRNDQGETAEPRLRAAAVICGIAGPLSLTVYFAAPAFTNWPYAGASVAQLTSYAASHQGLFYAGAWFQATGTLLSVIFFLAIVHLARAATRLSGLVTIVASAVLLSVVLIEGAFLMAVPQAAISGDAATVATAFALSNGVFVRVFPLAPASACFVGLGAVIMGSGVLHRWFGYVAVGIGAAFELAGIIALVSGIAVIAVIVLSVGEEVWTLAAVIALGLPVWKGRLGLQNSEERSRALGR